MKTGILAGLLGVLLLNGMAAAADMPAQQQKMTQCNQHASTQGLKGDARKTFMSDCLKKESKMANMSPQQLKMKSCNTQAGTKNLSGDARKSFMSQCLKKS